MLHVLSSHDSVEQAAVLLAVCGAAIMNTTSYQTYAIVACPSDLTRRFDLCLSFAWEYNLLAASRVFMGAQPRWRDG